MPTAADPNLRIARKPSRPLTFPRGEKPRGATPEGLRRCGSPPRAPPAKLLRAPPQPPPPPPARARRAPPPRTSASSSRAAGSPTAEKRHRRTLSAPAGHRRSAAAAARAERMASGVGTRGALLELLRGGRSLGCAPTLPSLQPCLGADEPPPPRLAAAAAADERQAASAEGAALSLPWAAPPWVADSLLALAASEEPTDGVANLARLVRSCGSSSSEEEDETGRSPRGAGGSKLHASFSLPTFGRAAAKAQPPRTVLPPAFGGKMKLDLSKLEVQPPVGDRPDSAARMPPTPTATVVAQIHAMKAGAVDGGAGGEGSPPKLSGSKSTPALANLGKALMNMSISELSEALSSSSRSLLGGASWAVDVSEITFGRRLGAGAYGEVYEAEWRRSRVAVKRLLTGGRWQLEENTIRQFFTEMEILSNARHDHIVKFLGGCVQPDNLCILFEFCPQSLYDLLSRATEPLKPAQLMRIAYQVALGIFYLHSCKPPVLHLDLKSANVLLDEYGKAKVCDFGLARLKLGSGVLTQRMGSPMWTAPEVLRGEERDETADTYSYGMLLYELMTRRVPYHDHESAQVMVGVITNLLPQPNLPEECVQLYPEGLRNLMCQCWGRVPKERPHFDKILDVLESVARNENVRLAGPASPG